MKNKTSKKRRRGNAVSQFYWEIGKAYGQVKRTKKFIECLEERIEKIFTTYQNDFDIEPLQMENMHSYCKWNIGNATYRLGGIINTLDCLKKNLDKEALNAREDARYKEKDERDPQPVQDEPEPRKPQHLVVG